MDKNEENQEQEEAPKWERRDFAINESMRKVIEASRRATEAEIKVLQRKLKKLQYGG